ncbi:MAG: response regulator transcription factor [Verrucomicrobiota bacterium]
MNPSCRKKKRILVVEDHPLFRAMLVQLIDQQPGMSVCGEASNISDALTIIEQQAPDAAIIDLTLTGSSGLELIKDLKARNIQLPVLVLSMHSERLYAERVLHAGAKGFISKEETPEQVIAAIHAVTHGEIYVSKQISQQILERQTRGGKPTAATGVELLSDREIEVYQLMGEGLSSCEISARLRLAPTTVDSYRARIKDKLGIKNAASLYQHAARWVAERSV